MLELLLGEDLSFPHFFRPLVVGLQDFGFGLPRLQIGFDAMSLGACRFQVSHQLTVIQLRQQIAGVDVSARLRPQFGNHAFVLREHVKLVLHNQRTGNGEAAVARREARHRSRCGSPRGQWSRRGYDFRAVRAGQPGQQSHAQQEHGNTVPFSFLHFHTPSHDQAREEIHKSGLRNKTYPAGYHPTRTFPRPSMPARIAPSEFGSATRAKNTRESPCRIPFGLTTVTSPRQIRVGKLLSLTEACSPARSKPESESSMATSTIAREVSTTSAKLSPYCKRLPTKFSTWGVATRPSIGERKRILASSSSSLATSDFQKSACIFCTPASLPSFAASERFICSRAI